MATLSNSPSWVVRRAQAFRVRPPQIESSFQGLKEDEHLRSAFLSYMWQKSELLDFAWQAHRRPPWTHFLGVAEVVHAPRRGDMLLAYGCDGLIFDAWVVPKKRYRGVRFNTQTRAVDVRVFPWPYDLQENLAFASALLLRPLIVGVNQKAPPPPPPPRPPPPPPRSAACGL